jgi:O-antigen/teichoic acid export membrane protein
MNPLMQACFAYLPSKGSLAYLGAGSAGLERWVRKTLWVLALAMLPFLVLLVGFPGAVLEVAYGDKYGGGELAFILGLATLAQCIGFSKYPFDLGLLALRSTRSIFFVYLIPVFLLVTAGAMLIHLLGILGVPISAMVINTALLIATWLAYARRVRRGPGAPETGSPRP